MSQIARALAAALAASSPLHAQAADAEPAWSAALNSVGADLFVSADAEDTRIVRAGINLDWHYEGPEEFRGLRLEKAAFDPLGQGWRHRQRIYVRGADNLAAWKWNGQVGTDGDTLLGAASIHDGAKFRKEFFVEREIVETPQGLDTGLYYTFAGAALDLPVDERNIVTLVAGLQEFTGDNVRTHLRGNYIHLLKPDWGVSAQLRTRWFRSSQPGEHDYYSPRWYAQVLPVLQMRRFTSKGWQYMAAAGWGIQRDSSSRWRSSRLFNANIATPALASGWGLKGSFLYSNTPVSTGFTYSYVQLSFGTTRAF